MISVSTKFKTAQNADVNTPTAKVQLLLGNYFSASGYGSTVASNGDDGSGNFPAAGAIDGDRTEINVGAASGADNGVGKSSWRSAANPSGGSPAVLTTTLTASKTLNRIKVYHLSTNWITSYDLRYWNGSSYVVFAATADIVSGGQVSIPNRTAGGVDVVDFPDIASNLWRIQIYTVHSGHSDLVEIEGYRRVDITSRVKGIKVSRQRDYKIDNPLASTIELDVINSDRFFSFSHVPTAAEVTAGFVNQELLPNMGILVSWGFLYTNAVPELVTGFVGYTDRITVKPATRDAVISGRDSMKILLNKPNDSSNLKTSQDISALIKYMLNRSDISNYEMALDTTGINVDTFFTDQASILDTIRDLAQASGDSLFFFDETGIATFKFYTQNVANSHLYSSEADWESGSQSNTDTTSFPGQLAIAFAEYVITTGVNDSLDFTYHGAPVTGVATIAAGTYNSIFALAAAVNTAVHAFQTALNATVNGTKIEILIASGTLDLLIASGANHAKTAYPILGWTGASNITGASTSVTAPIIAPPTTGEVYDNLSSISPDWTTFNTGAITWNTSGGMFNTAGSINGDGSIYRTCFGAVRYWQYDYQFDPTGVSGGFASADAGFFFFADTFNYSATNHTLPQNGYLLNAQATPGASAPNASLSLLKVVGGVIVGTAIATFAYAEDNSTHTITINRDPFGNFTIQRDGTTVITVTDTTFQGGTYVGFYTATFNAISSPFTHFDNLYMPPTGFPYSGELILPALDTGLTTIAFGTLDPTDFTNNGTIAYATRSSPDNITFSSYVPLSGTNQIQSPVARYLQIKIDMEANNGTIYTIGDPRILDLTANWTSGSGSPKYPSSGPDVPVLAFNSTMLDVQQELADNLGGDTAIINDVFVQAQPLVLEGLDADTVWQGTIGSPPTPISAGTPLTVTAGVPVVVMPYISGGMDISRMSGASPAALVVTFASSATGSWVATRIHPTLPIFTITITHNGTITDLRLTGKVYSSTSFIQVQNVTNAPSIALYGDRQLSISNSWVGSAALALTIANSILSNFDSPVSYIPNLLIRPYFNMQIGDRITVVDVNLDLSADYINVGLDQQYSVNDMQGTIQTTIKALKVPAGL